MVFEGKVNPRLLPNRQAQTATVSYKKERLNTSFAELLSEEIQSVLQFVLRSLNQMQAALKHQFCQEYPLLCPILKT